MACMAFLQSVNWFQKSYVFVQRTTYLHRAWHFMARFMYYAMPDRSGIRAMDE
jgi:hypothetical protein